MDSQSSLSAAAPLPDVCVSPFRLVIEQRGSKIEQTKIARWAYKNTSWYSQTKKIFCEIYW
jgi:hypothetical protein